MWIKLLRGPGDIRIPELLMQCVCISTHLTYFDHQFKAIVAALTDLDNVVVTKRHNKATTLEYLLKYYQINLIYSLNT